MMIAWSMKDGGKIGILNRNPQTTLDIGEFKTEVGQIKKSGAILAGWIYLMGHDAVYNSYDPHTNKVYDLIGTYHGWDPNSIYIGGYNVADQEGYSDVTSVSFGGWGDMKRIRTTTMFVDFMTRRVGVNTITPKVDLDVNGGIKVGNGGAECNSDKEGTISYDKSTKKMRFCDGISWKEM